MHAATTKYSCVKLAIEFPPVKTFPDTFQNYGQFLHIFPHFQVFQTSSHALDATVPNKVVKCITRLEPAQRVYSILANITVENK